MPTLSPTFRPEDSVPLPSLATLPTPSWPPTWPGCVGKGRMLHCYGQFSVRLSLVWVLTYGVCHDTKVGVAHARVSPVLSVTIQESQHEWFSHIDQNLANTRLRHIQFHNLRGHRPGLVIDGSLLFLGDLRDSHIELRISRQLFCVVVVIIPMHFGVGVKSKAMQCREMETETEK